MKKTLLAALLAALMLVCTGCASFLERDYSVVQPHSSTYYESEDRSVLRAESYQDLVNDLMLLLTGGAREGTIWLYAGTEPLDASAAAERACKEVQQETPLGAYAVKYLTYTIDDSARNYTAIHLTIGYRRTQEQIASMVYTTSVSALGELLTAAARRGSGELVVQVGSEAMLWRTVRAGFALRRKTLVNSLQTGFPLPKDQLAAIVTGCGKIGGNLAVIGVCDARFLMSSMGHNVGEKITRAVERATREKLPVVLFACSGGARMQEGIVSLMQMAKTAAALKHHHDAGQLFVSVLTASPPALPCWEISSWRNRGPSSALPAPGSSSRPSARSCRRGSREQSFFWITALWIRSWRERN